jgi:hypothetical protein
MHRVLQTLRENAHIAVYTCLACNLILVGGLEHVLFFPEYMGMSSSQLPFTPSFFRAVAKNHQPDLFRRHR